MSAHTPGPWVAGDDEGSDYYLVGPHDGNGIVYQSAVELHIEADTRLIAAAPEMLAALQAVLAEIEGPDRPHSTDSWLPAHLAHQVRAAIAKAEGGAA